MSDRLDDILTEFASAVYPLAAQHRGWNNSDQDKAKQALQSYIDTKVIEGRIDELEKSQRALERPPKGIDTGLMNIDLIEWWFKDRLTELKALNHRKEL